MAVLRGILSVVGTVLSALYKAQSRIPMKARLIAVPVIALLAFIGFELWVQFGGRTASRYLGKEYAQELVIPNMDCTKGDKGTLCISFSKRGESTVKDVTFYATDGYMYTREFKDVDPFGGVIRWVPHGEGSSLFQSRKISRWTGGVVEAELPEGFVSFLNVDIDAASETERVKNLVFLHSDGKVYSREYRDGIIDRKLEGWCKVVPGDGSKFADLPSSVPATDENLASH